MDASCSILLSPTIHHSHGECVWTNHILSEDQGGRSGILSSEMGIEGFGKEMDFGGDGNVNSEELYIFMVVTLVSKVGSASID